MIASAHDALEQACFQRWLEADHLSARADLIQALGGGYEQRPGPTRLRPTPEDNGLNPHVNLILSLGGG